MNTIYRSRGRVLRCLLSIFWKKLQKPVTDILVIRHDVVVIYMYFSECRILFYQK